MENIYYNFLLLKTLPYKSIHTVTEKKFTNTNNFAFTNPYIGAKNWR